ncbi:MAG: MCP four helix bundle domain-containing protein, partial [Gallionella sp.]
MNNLTIKTRLVIVIGFLSMLLIVIGSYGLWGMSQSNAGLRTVYEDRTVPMGQLDTIVRALLRNRLAIEIGILNSTVENIKTQTQAVEENIDLISKTWVAYRSTYLTPDEKILADKFAVNRKKLVSQGLKPAIAALRAGEPSVALSLVTNKITPTYQNVSQSINALIQLQLNVAKQTYVDSNNSFASTRTSAIALIVIGIALAVWMGMMLINGIGRGLRSAIDAAEKIAMGDLSTQIVISSNDEIATLLKSMNQMQAAINDFVSAQGVMADKHSEGWIKAQIDEARFPGTYGKMAREINELVNSHITVKMKVVEIITQYAKGDFSPDMD